MIATDSTLGAEQYQDLFKRFASALQEHIETPMDEAKVRDIVDEAVASARLPRSIEVTIGDRKVTMTDRVHKQFEELLDLVQEGHGNILMVGPAGSGKTTLARNIAKALDTDFGFISLSAGVTETHLFGRMLPQSDGSWAYQPSRFVQVYRNGGVFLLDEIDAADSNVMVSVNAALANGCLSNPVTGEVIERHAGCWIIAAANTFGRGGSTQYVGRNALDAATLDRFVLATVFVTYDTELENDIAVGLLGGEKANELLAWVGVLRGRVEHNRLRRVVSTRLVVNGAKALAKGKVTLDGVKKRFFVDWTPDEIAKVGEAV